MGECAGGKRWWCIGAVAMVLIATGCEDAPTPDGQMVGQTILSALHSRRDIPVPSSAFDHVRSGGQECPPLPDLWQNHHEPIGAVATAFLDVAASQPAPTYTLFHPQPLPELKPMVTDRPGVTNGPYTVAPGHLQVESGVLNYTYDHATRLSRVDVFGGTELRLGLVDNLEFAVTLNPFSWQRIDGTVTTGFGDTTLQGKWTVWSDATGAAAVGVIPFVTLNTAQHGLGAGGTVGGMDLPIAISLPADFGLGMMPGVFAAPNSPSGTHAQVVGSVNLSHPVVGTLSAFGEFAASIDVKHPSGWVGTVDFGLVYLITPNLQIDTGMNVGVTKAAPDLSPFLGLSARF